MEKDVIVHFSAVFSEVHEYSAFTEQELPQGQYIKIDNILESSEVVSTDSGSIVYFDSPITGLLEPGICYQCELSPISAKTWKEIQESAMKSYIDTREAVLRKLNALIKRKDDNN